MMSKETYRVKVWHIRNLPIQFDKMVQLSEKKEHMKKKPAAGANFFDVVNPGFQRFLKDSPFSESSITTEFQ